MIVPFIWSCGQGGPRPELVSVEGRNGEIARLTMLGEIRHGEAYLSDHKKTRERSGNYSNGLKHGLWTEKRNGVLYRTADLRHGRFHGMIVTYNTTGQKAHEVEMAHGLRHGLEVFYFSDGTPRRIINNVQGLRDGKFERWTRDDPETKGNYILGKYCAGEKCGVWTKAYPNGKTRWAINMLDGKRHGEMNFWNDQGELIEIWTYDQGEVVEKRMIEK